MSKSNGAARTAGPIRALLIAALIGVLLAAALLVYRSGNSGSSAADYDGEGEGMVMLRVSEGESLGEVGEELENLNVVKSAQAFNEAANLNTALNGLQPGYYQLREEMKGSVAAALLADPNSRVGWLQVPAGSRLKDTTVVGGPGAQGIYTLMSEASCLRSEDANEPPQCKSAEEFRQVAETADPASLGVPEWAINEVSPPRGAAVLGQPRLRPDGFGRGNLARTHRFLHQAVRGVRSRAVGREYPYHPLRIGDGGLSHPA